MTVNELIQKSKCPTLRFNDTTYLFNKIYTDETGCQHLDYISVKDLHAWYEQMEGNRNRNNAHNGDEL